MKKYNKFSLKAFWVTAIIFVAILFAFFGGTYAYFTARANDVQDQVQTAILRVGFSADTNMEIKSVSSQIHTLIEPGDTVTYTGKVENNGNIEMYAVIELELKIDDAIYYRQYYSADGVVLGYDETTEKFTSPATKILSTQTSSFSINFTFDGDSYANVYQNKSGTFILTAHAIQTAYLPTAVDATNELLKDKPLSFTSGIVYREVEDGLEVMGLVNYTEPTLIIPSNYNGKDVVSISSVAFNGKRKLQAVVIPETVQKIEANENLLSSFYSCNPEIIVFCEANSKPAGWVDSWNNYLKNEQLHVVWNASEQDYSKIDTTYSLKFYNGSMVIQTETIKYLQKAYFNGTIPSKAADNNYTYTFVGWQNASGQDVNLNELRMTADLNLYAKFDSVEKLYTVNFYNYDGKLLHSTNVKYGASATYSSTPVRASFSDTTYTYTYTFKNWVTTNGGSTAANLNSITANTNVWANFTETKTYIDYSVNFYNDTKLLQTATCHYGGSVSYTGTTPTRDSKTINGVTYTYTFDKWVTTNGGTVAASLSNITANKSVYASFKETTTSSSFEVKFYNGGTLLYTATVNSGGTATYGGSTPTKASSSDNTYNYTYTFDKWVTTNGGTTAASLTNITANKNVYASFTETRTYIDYSVKFYNGTSLLQTKTCHYNGSVTYTGSTPTKSSKTENGITYTYTFDKWVTTNGGSTAATLTNITADKNVYASFTETQKAATYQVDFYNGSTFLESKTTNYNGSVTFGGQTPTRSMTQNDRYITYYTFKGWSESNEASNLASIDKVVSNMNVYAVFNEKTYEMVDYIQSTGNKQWIDTGVNIADYNTDIVIDYEAEWQDGGPIIGQESCGAYLDYCDDYPDSNGETKLAWKFYSVWSDDPYDYYNWYEPAESFGSLTTGLNKRYNVSYSLESGNLRLSVNGYIRYYDYGGYNCL